MDEEYKKIPGFNNYECNKNGYVRNSDTKRILKPQEMRSGYMSLCLLSDNNKQTSLRVHRLIATTWLDNPENKPTVNHKNKNRSDNNLDNLERSSHKEQTNHRDTNRHKKINHARGIWKCDKTTGNPITFYKTIKEAGIDINNDENSFKNISLCANGKTDTAYGYKWKFPENNIIEGEEWKLITCIENNKTYYVSNNGRIKNRNRILNMKPHHSGYVLCQIKDKQHSIHILVATMFILKLDPTKNIVNHIDGNRCNNVVINLEWVTQNENANHAIISGLRKNVLKVIYYDNDLNIISIYNSCKEAGLALNVNITSVNKCCKKQLKSCGKEKLLFKYLDNSDDLVNKKCNIRKDIKISVKKEHKPIIHKVYVFDRIGNNFIDTCDNVTIASKKYNCNPKTIVAQCTNKVKYPTTKYLFKFEL